VGGGGRRESEGLGASEGGGRGEANGKQEVCTFTPANGKQEGAEAV